jgi:protein-L-isoaspartate(D-aspartate) O-methyltransferase
MQMIKINLSVLLIFIMFLQTDEFTAERKKMIEDQIIARGITNKATILAMQEVPRHKFVPKDAKVYAYRDSPLQIGYGQTISQPYIVAFMTASLDLHKNDTVLEIGTGSGYQAAVLSKIVAQIYTIEIVEPLGLQAIERFKNLGYGNIETKIGDGYHGWKEHAPYHAIIVTANVEEIPPELINQLAEGGKLIIPVGPQGYGQNLVLVTKQKDKIKKKNLLPVRFVPFTRDRQ